jgi:hypothetical protein
LAYNYCVSFEIDEMIAAEPDRYATGDPYDTSSSTEAVDADTAAATAYQQALTAMVLPALVWGLCIFRAWQFQRVLHDAEVEAASRGPPGGEEDDDDDPRDSGDVELAAWRTMA